MLPIFFYIFIGLVCIQLIYWLGFYSRLALAKSILSTPKRIPVSVILYTKNQVTDLLEILPNLLSQQYHDFEIVIVNNASVDDTLEICKEFASLYPNIRIVDVQNNEAFWGSKRYALTLGIKASRHEYLLFVDCGTKINSENWLWQMSSQFTLNKTIVLGQTQFEKTKGFLNKRIRLEHSFSQIQSFAFSKIIKPYSLTAQNIGYKKEEFYKVNGFIEYMNEPIHEQELLLKKIATHKNIAFSILPNTRTTLPTPSNKKEWKEHKKTQNRLLKRLSFGNKMMHAMYYLSKFTMYGMAITLLIFMFQPILVISILLALFIVSWIIFSISLKKINQKDLKWLFPLFEIFSIFKIINNLPIYFSKSK